MSRNKDTLLLLCFPSHVLLLPHRSMGSKSPCFEKTGPIGKAATHLHLATIYFFTAFFRSILGTSN